MNNNRCLFCNKIIPEGRQICPTCEKEQTLKSVTPENELCRNCKIKCKGDRCKSLKAYIQGLKASFTKSNKIKQYNKNK